MAMLQAKTESGMVEGLRANNPFYTVFRGIPFMAPPVGQNRWRAPQPAEPWEGVKQCYIWKPTAMQPKFGSGGGLIASEFYGVERPMSEDCMYLNIWTPAESPDEKLPVAVYSHGGGYSTGMAYQQQFDGEGFNKRGVIFVTIPYRLNVFGFLAHPELTEEAPYHSSGNYGLLDMVWGLHWVKNNIANFGGDPDNISMFGQSAGAMNVSAMTTTPLTGDIIKHAIMQSGGGLSHGGMSPWGKDLASAEKLGQDFFDFLGVSSLKEARSLTTEEVFRGFEEFGGTERYESDKQRYAGLYTRFSPIMNDGYVFPDNKGNMILDGRHKHIDYILGSTQDEFRFMTAQNLAFAKNQLNLGLNPAYLYYFSYVPPGAESEGAHHSVEHHYVFQTLYRTMRPYNGFDFDLSNELADRWAAFFKTGNPNPEGKNYVEWTPYSEEDQKVLGIVAGGREMIDLPIRENELQWVDDEMKKV